MAASSSLLAAPADAAVHYASSTVTTGEGPTTSVLADLDGDGKNDLVTSNWGHGTTPYGSTVSVLMGHGDGTFASKTDYTVGSGPRGVVAADLNGDGHLDLATISYYTSTVSVLIGNGDGTFAPATTVTTPSGGNAISSADLNGDGNADLVLGTFSGATVLLGNGNGTFQLPVSYATGSFAAGVAIADLDNDGKLDLAVVNENSSTLSILRGAGDGTFAAATNYAEPVNSSPASVAAVDLDGNGYKDLVLADAGSSKVSVRLNSGTGTFPASTTYPTGGLPTSVVAADMDGDGHADVVTGNQAGNNVSVLLGDGAGGLGAATNFASGSGTAYAAVGNLNGDALPDIATADDGTHTSTVLINTALPSCTAGSGNASFSFTGTEQCYVVPAGVTTVHVVATGAGGRSRTGTGGFGAQATSDLPVTPGEVLYVEVGGSGAFQSGWNGGGTFSGGLASGGGATDVRTCSRLSCTLTGNAMGDPRLLVAGGGGGTGQSGNNSTGGEGGSSAADGAAGEDSTPAGTSVASTGGRGATQNGAGAGGTGGLQNGVAGTAGSGGSACVVDNCYQSGGGGGGGWFGGGSGGSGNLDGTGNSGGGAGGGAGSSHGPALASFATATTTTGSVVFSLPPPPAPTVTTAAAIAGPPVQGAPLTGSATFSGQTSVAYAWQRCDSAGANCGSALATTAAYTLAADDVGHVLKFTATADNGGSTTASSASTAPVTATQTSVYSGDATAADANGFYDGTWAYGTPAYTADRSGTANSAFSFEGSSAITASSSVAAFGANDWTVSLWVSAPANGKQELISTRPGCNSGGFDLRIKNGSAFGETWFSDGYHPVQGTTRIDDGTWHKVTLVRSGGSVSVAVDGVLDATTTVGAGAALTPGNVLSLGAGGCVGTDTTVRLTGALDDVHLVNGLAEPIVTQPASISGTPTEGQTLTAAASFDGTSPTTTYVWNRCDAAGANCVIPVGTGTTYQAASADAGHVLSVTAAATNDAGAVSSIARTTGAIAPLNAAPSAGGDQTASAVAGQQANIDVTPTAADSTGSAPTSARITAIPSTFTLQRTDGTPLAVGDDVPLVAGHLLAHLTASDPADAAIHYAMVDGADSSLVSAASAILVKVTPWLSIDGGPATGSTTSDQNPSFSFSGAGTGGRYECSVDAATTGACTSPDQLSNLAFGPHSFTATAIDTDGDRSTAQTVTWNILEPNAAPSPGGDQTASAVAGQQANLDVTPTAADSTGSAPTSARITAIPSTFTLQRTDGTALAVGDDVPLVAGHLLAHLTASNPADAAIHYAMVDGADSSLVSAASAILVKVTPSLSIDGGPTTGSTTSDQNPAFSFSGAGTGGRYECSVDAATAGACTSPDQLSNLAFGPHSFTATAIDTDGDRSTAQTVTWNILEPNAAPSPGGDQTATAVAGQQANLDVTPTAADATGSAPTSARITAIPPTFTLQRTDGTALAVGDDVPLVAGHLLAHLTASNPADAAIHYAMVDAADSSLVSAASAILVKVTPVVSIDSGPATGAVASDQNPAFSFSGAGTGGRYECSVDGAPAGACSSPKQLSNLPFGPHSFAVTAVDADGDRAATRTVSWTISGSLGAPVIIGGPPAETGDTGASLQFQVDPGSVAQCSLDGSAYTWCASPVAYNGLALGRHTFAVRQIDAAGDVSPASTRSWHIDVGFEPSDTDGANVKTVQGLVNQVVAPVGQVVGVGCQLNSGSLHECDVDAYADTSGLRSVRSKHRRARAVSLEKIGSGSVVIPNRGQSGAVVGVTLNAAGVKLMKAHPEGVPMTLSLVAKPYDTDRNLVSTQSSTLRPPQMVVVPSRGLFGGRSTALSSSARAWVKAVVKLLDGARKVRCDGYTDNTASASRAKALSLSRAKAVCTALTNAGLQAPASSVGRGAAHPVGDNKTAAGRARNRRVEVRVWF